MDDVKSNGYVRWKGFIGIMIILFGGMFGFTYALVNKVESNTVSQKEFLQFEKRIDANILYIKERVDKLR